jgi:hypothetical protein
MEHRTLKQVPLDRLKNSTIKETMAQNDIEELWRLIERAPCRILYRPDDAEGYHMDLLCRSGKEILKNDILKETIEFLLCKHPLSGILRPVIMTVARFIDGSIQTFVNRNTTD